MERISKLTAHRTQQVGRFTVNMSRHARSNGPAVYMLSFKSEDLSIQLHLGDRSCFETLDDMLDDFMAETPNADLVDPEAQRRLDFPEPEPVRTKVWRLADYFREVLDTDAPEGREDEVWTCCDGWPEGCSPETHESMWVTRGGAIHDGTHFGSRDTFIRERPSDPTWTVERSNQMGERARNRLREIYGVTPDCSIAEAARRIAEYPDCDTVHKLRARVKSIFPGLEGASTNHIIDRAWRDNDGPYCHSCGKPADESHTVVGGFVYCSGPCVRDRYERGPDA
jgi:hypothetical protein